jgi:hypothetical protein
MEKNRVQEELITSFHLGFMHSVLRYIKGNDVIFFLNEGNEIEHHAKGAG